MNRRHVTLCALFCGVLCAATPLEAYLKLGVSIGGQLIELKWDRRIEYFVTNQDVPGVTAPQLQAAIGRAFSTWAAVPRTAVTHNFVGITGAQPVGGDGISVVGFRARPELENTLAAASFEVDEITGRILEVDIFFNTTVPWSVSTNGVSGSFDIESVGLHEVGHLLGLGHSALGETEIRAEGGRRVLGKRAVMFPIAYPAGNIEDRTLEADDRAALTDVYGNTEARRETGSLRGRVTLNGQGIFGAHVTATHTSTGETVGGFTLTSTGEFVIGALPPGIYIVRAEPLDDADIDSFFDDDGTVNIGFAPAVFEKLVAVPRGGAGPAMEIRVKAK
jgi:hypothetical protein